MLKGVARGEDGRQILVLGITRDNVRALERGQPIMVDQRQLRDTFGQDVPDQDVVIFFGETFRELTQELRSTGLNVPDMAEPQPGTAFYYRSDGRGQP